MLGSLVHRTHTGIAAACTAVAALAAGSCEQKGDESTSASRVPGASPSAGTFEGSWNASGTRRTIPLGTKEDGGERRAAAVDLHGTMSLTGPGRPGLSFRADVVALTDSATGLVGRGTWTDERGDQVFSELKGEGTRERNHIEGKIIGGTGRYGGVSGSYEFSWSFFIESEDGTIQGRAVGLKGEYKLAAVAGNVGARTGSTEAPAKTEGATR